MIEVVVIHKESSEVLNTCEGDFTFTLVAKKKGDTRYNVESTVAGKWSRELFISALSEHIGETIKKIAKGDPVKEVSMIEVFCENLRGIKNDNEK